jgi:hypothetical protein
MATTQELLTQAQDAYHALVTGKSPRVVVDQSGERVEFNAANKGALAQYIQSLESKIATTSLNRPMKVFF